MSENHPDEPFEVRQLRPAEDGARKALFDLEAEIMEAFWSSGQSRLLVRDVHELLQAGRPLAYTTIMTTMDRLWKKRVLERERQGRAYIYWSRLSRDEFHRQVALQVLDSLMPEAVEPLLASFVDHAAAADAEHLDRLEQLIRHKREELRHPPREQE